VLELEKQRLNDELQNARKTIYELSKLIYVNNQELEKQKQKVYIE